MERQLMAGRGAAQKRAMSTGAAYTEAANASAAKGQKWELGRDERNRLSE